ncbi:MAG: hypothetical protein EOO20_18355 [Chryseobacterium sp.]|nr:MAG: hypothetical protein EOO20_18355 [Chryseobacterium sp.]
MTTITSKRHFFKFYFSLIFLTLILIALASGLLLMYNSRSSEGLLRPKDKFIPLVSIVCLVFAGYSLFRYFKNAPILTVDNDFISFNSQIFSITDIEKINFTGKQPFNFIVDFPMEGASVIFKTGEKKYIFDDMYSNAAEIKSFLKQIAVEKVPAVQGRTSPVDVAQAANEHYEVYSDNAIFSLQGITLFGFVGFFVYLIWNRPGTYSFGPLVFLTVINIFWVILHAYFMHYFKVSDTFFIVRNHIYFWKKRIYNLADISEVVFETRSKFPNCLRVIDVEFGNKLYPAGTLRDKTWLRLQDKLRAHNIPVRNECIWSPPTKVEQ